MTGPNRRDLSPAVACAVCAFALGYQISTQPMVDTPCYLADVAYSSDFLPSFTFWIYQTPTNMSGVLLTLWMILFYTVAACRNYIYSIFLLVHKYFIVIYIMLVVHGMHQLFAYPVFWPFFIAQCHQRTNTTEQSSQIGHRKGQTRNMRCLHVCVERLMLTLVSLSLCAALSPFLQQRSICSSEQRFSRSSSRTPIQCDKCTESGYTIRACESSWTMDLLAVQTISSDASHS